MNSTHRLDFIRCRRRVGGVWGLVAALALLLSSGCSSSRKTTAVKVKERTPEFLVRQMLENQVNAEWMDAKAKVNFDDGYMSMGATASIRLRKDSVLWIAVKKLGFEVGRAMITPDSIYVLDRLNNEAVVKDLGYLAKVFHIPADFQMLQSLMLGNPLFFMTRGFQSEMTGQRYRVYGSRDGLESTYWIGGRHFQLESMSFDDQRTRRRVHIRFEEYDRAAENQIFSYLRNLEVDSQQTGKVSIDIRFSQVEFNVPKNIRFEIPDRYTRVE
jgi:hypothetical protein